MTLYVTYQAALCKRRAPRLVGWLLKCFVWLVESWFFPPVRAVLERNNEVPQTLKETKLDEPPLFTPVHSANYGTTLPCQKLDSEGAVSKANAASEVAG